MTLAETARGELAPTASYSRREWQWRTAYPGEEERDGTLTLLLTEDLRRGPRTRFFYYAVQVERDQAVPEGVWSFLLENEREPDADGPFRCVVGGMYETCGCEAGGFDRRRVEPTGCKHRDALRAVVQQGVFG